MLNIGFIGCGGIARNHASRLTHIRGARIVAAADVVADAARGFARDYGAPYHADDYRRILERPELDAVWVCTPTHQHPAPVIAAARAGKHVFCEKPMALTMAAARRMKKACDEHGVRLTIGFVRRFDAQWGKLKQIVQSGDLGTPVIWRFAAGGRPANPWFRDETKGGGPLMDGAIHNYDYALQIFGPAASVQASSLQFGMTAQHAPKSFDPKKHGAFTLKAANGREKVYPFPHRDMFSEQLKHVVRAFAKNEQPLVNGQDGIDALAIASAVLKSGKSRRTVKI